MALAKAPSATPASSSVVSGVVLPTRASTETMATVSRAPAKASHCTTPRP